jgi:hypothetical protein
MPYNPSIDFAGARICLRVFSGGYPRKQAEQRARRSSSKSLAPKRRSWPEERSQWAAGKAAEDGRDLQPHWSDFILPDPTRELHGAGIDLHFLRILSLKGTEEPNMFSPVSDVRNGMGAGRSVH